MRVSMRFICIIAAIALGVAIASQLKLPPLEPEAPGEFSLRLPRAMAGPFFTLCAVVAVVVTAHNAAWAFIAPGLYQREKRVAAPLLVSSMLLFYAGCAFAYFVLLPAMFKFLSMTRPEGVMMMPDIARYLDFVAVIALASGFSFEVPVAIMILVLLGWVTPKQLSEVRGYAVIAIFVIAMIITPGDGLSMVMMAIPMCLLYEAGILAARLVAPKDGKPVDAAR